MLKLVILFLLISGPVWAQLKVSSSVACMDESDKYSFSATGSKIINCEESHQTVLAIIQKTQFSAVPNFIKEQFSQEALKKIGPFDEVYLTLATQNDDLYFVGLCEARDQACSDDLGYTVGSSIGIGGKLSQSQNSIELKLENGLYTSQVSPQEISSMGLKTDKVYQKVRSVLLLEAMLMSKEKNDTYFWRLGGGLMNISSKEKFGMLNAAKQQRSLHKILNSFEPGMAAVRTNLDDGEPDSWGAYIVAGFGYIKSQQLGFSRSTLITKSEVSGRLSNINDHSEMRVSFNFSLKNLDFLPKYLTPEFELTSTKHKSGLLHELKGFINFELEPNRILKVGIICSKGKLPQYATYNGSNFINKKNDCLYQIQYKQIFY